LVSNVLTIKLFISDVSKLQQNKFTIYCNGKNKNENQKHLSQNTLSYYLKARLYLSVAELSAAKITIKL